MNADTDPNRMIPRTVRRFCRSRTATVMAFLGGTLMPVLTAAWVSEMGVATWVIVAAWLLAIPAALAGGAAAFGYDFDLRFKWYDLWVGAYIDHAKRTLYVCPLPCLLFTFEPADSLDKEQGPSLSDHQASAATQPGPGGASASIAWCTCGWRGERAYITRAEAQAEADQHAKENRP